MANLHDLNVLDFDTVIDRDTFSQVLEMDDDDVVRDFSRDIIFDFLKQAGGTTAEIQEAIDNADLAKLSDLGHFLKGSSATLGFLKVQDSCEIIQRYGRQEDLAGVKGVGRDECFDKIGKALVAVRKEIDEVKGMMSAFYGTEDNEQDGSGDEEEGDEEDDDDDDDDDDDEEDDEEEDEGDYESGEEEDHESEEEEDVKKVGEKPIAQSNGVAAQNTTPKTARS